MASVNKMTVMGRLGRDPEVRYTPSGSAVANLRIATSRSWKNKETGEKVEETEWHSVVFYDKLAEVVGEYMKKGGLLYVEGRLRTRKWKDKDGIERYTTEIIGEEMQMVGGGREDAEVGGRASPGKGSGAAKPTAWGGDKSGPDDDIDGDVPF